MEKFDEVLPIFVRLAVSLLPVDLLLSPPFSPLHSWTVFCVVLCRVLRVGLICLALVVPLAVLPAVSFSVATCGVDVGIVIVIVLAVVDTGVVGVVDGVGVVFGTVDAVVMSTSATVMVDDKPHSDIHVSNVYGTTYSRCLTLLVVERSAVSIAANIAHVIVTLEFG